MSDDGAAQRPMFGDFIVFGALALVAACAFGLGLIIGMSLHNG